MPDPTQGPPAPGAHGHGVARPPDHGAALLDLYERALPQVYGYLVPRCGNIAVAEELTAETFLAAVDAVRRATVQDVTVAWLIGIARHKLADHWRRRAREERKLTAVRSSGPPETSDPWDDHLEAVRARATLRRLGPHHQAVLTLRYLDGLPVADVAAHLRRSVQATEALLTRAKAAFRKAYDEEAPA
jgi:RNA polymerase sigma-70 factor (ECF subfamily)